MHYYHIESEGEDGRLFFTGHGWSEAACLRQEYQSQADALHDIRDIARRGLHFGDCIRLIEDDTTTIATY